MDNLSAPPLPHVQPAGEVAAGERRVLALINAHSGTVRSLGVETVRQRLADGLSAMGAADVEIVRGADIDERIRASLAAKAHDIIVIGGGDGTISAAARLLAGTGVTMGVLPLGTMNLVARAINLGAELETALARLQSARPMAVDLGRVNGRAFLHQVSFGLQPRMVRIREKIGYRSQFTKLLSSGLAFMSALGRPRAVKFMAEIDGAVRKLRIPALSVSNNLYRDDTPPVTQRLDGGVLGVYIITATRFREYVRLIYATWRGRWRKDVMVEAFPARRVKLSAKRHRAKVLCSIDGELTYLRSPVEIEIEPKALQMLVPEEG
jgi:diacylglycerol kinase family enzyme